MQSLARLFHKIRDRSARNASPPSPPLPLPEVEPQEPIPPSDDLEQRSTELEYGELTVAAETVSVQENKSDDVKKEGKKIVKVAVLLDGDGDHFPSTYTSKGVEGGRRAALELHKGIERFVRERFGRRSAVDGVAIKPSVRISLQSFMNGKGAGLHSSTEKARSFMQGFNSSLLPFTIVDVGTANQAADTVIKAQLKFLFDDVDLIIVGGCHDDGYAPQLRELNSRCPGKIVLLLSNNRCTSSIKQLGLEKVHFELLFSPSRPTGPAPVPVPALLARPAPPEQSLPPSKSPLSVPFKFIPLLRTIAATGLDRPLCSFVAGELAKQVARLEWRSYRDEAEQLGLVTLDLGEAPGSECIAIAPSYKTFFPTSRLSPRRVVASAVSSPSLSPPSIPKQYLPLLRCIRAHSSSKPLCNDIADQLRAQGLFPPERWGRHTDAAQRLGLVTKRETANKDVHTISINPGVVVPTTINFVVHRPQPRPVSDPSPFKEEFTSAFPDALVIPTKFLPLVHAVLAQPAQKPLCDDVAAYLRNRSALSVEGWREHTNEAQSLGLVTKELTPFRDAFCIFVNPGVNVLPAVQSLVSPIADGVGVPSTSGTASSVRIPVSAASVAPPTASAVVTSSTSIRAVASRLQPPPLFRALVGVLRELPGHGGPLGGVVGEKLARIKPKPFPGRLKVHVKAAEKAGVVVTTNFHKNSATVRLSSRYI